MLNYIVLDLTQSNSLFLLIQLKEITMAVIENFVVLPAKEQLEFAAKLLETINSKNLFSDNTNFEIISVEADELTGGLWIEVSHTNPIEVSREATWTCDTEDSAESDPGYDADYYDLIFEDAKKAFKTLSAEVDGYKVSLELHDVDEGDTVSVKADNISHEDSGIGGYEYWGHRGYDSNPYVEVSGTIVKACECAIAFSVEPIDTVAEEPAVEEE
jgi:hypothetical protein